VTASTGLADSIFRAGSRTYYNASRFFPPGLRRDVTTLYAFVRRADDFVDAVPQDADGFRAFRDTWRLASTGRGVDDPVVGAFTGLWQRDRFPKAWVEAFLDAMEADLTVRSYDTVDAVLGYIYGSAEVIGLFMARLMKLPPEAEAPARMLGRAMQYVNFIRDFREDVALGRRYLPLEGADPRVTDPAWARAHGDELNAFLRRHIARYRGWAAEGRKGFTFIPRRYRIPIAAAQDMYDWTAERIDADPLVVLDRTVKPGKPRIIAAGLVEALRPGR
jgi:15-cis-phytoene synthase